MKKALPQVQAAVPAALPLGPHHPAGPMVPGVSVTDGDAAWSLWQGPIGEFPVQTLKILQQSLAVIYR